MNETQGMSQGQDIPISQPVASSTPESVSTPTPSQATNDERTFRQHEVNDIVGRAKHEAVERYKRANEAQFNQAPQQQPSSYNSDERFRQIAAEEAKRHLDSVRQDALQQSQNEMAQRTVNSFYSKIQTGKEKYQDFDKVTGDIDLARFPNIVQLMAEYVDNPQDVYYELGRDRIKMATLESLAERSPQDAIKAAHALAQSIKDNEQSAKVRLPNEPLSTLRPSNTGTDTGAMSVSDYRKKYRA